MALFGRSLDASGRRFALAETLAHLERLVRQARAARAENGGTVTYTATQILLDDDDIPRRPPGGRA